MDLPDCPPGAEGYQDTVTEVPKKPEDNPSTKAEEEFLSHLKSLKIKVEDGSYRCMVERRGRDVSGKWIYVCYPCTAMCSGETILQTHISGKKHKAKLSLKTVWPVSIFQNHPYKQTNATTSGVTPALVKKMAEVVEVSNEPISELEAKYNKLRNVPCHIQETLDNVKAPLIGLEYLIEHPPIEAHYEPTYICTLCNKQGHPRTIVNHMTCYWHRHNYLQRHYPKACDLLKPYRSQSMYRDGVMFIMSRIAQRIVEKYGLMKPVNIDKEEYDRDKEAIHQWIFKGKHFAETPDCTFEEVVDTDLIDTLHKSNDPVKVGQKDPSPPFVAAPKPQNNSNFRAQKRDRRQSLESLSDLSDFDDIKNDSTHRPPIQKKRLDRYPSPKGRDLPSSFRNKYGAKLATAKVPEQPKTSRAPNYEYKIKLAEEQRKAAEDAAKKTLAYHEKNPEKHPLYPEEWKKFWNRRYKEIQAEGKDPSKHDFKPEWIVYWTGRMKELHVEELRIQVTELYRRLRLTPPGKSPPPDKGRKDEFKERRRSSERDRRLPEPRRRSPERRRTPERRRSPFEPRRRTPEPRRRTPEPRRRTPDLRRRTPPHLRRDHRSPPNYRIDRRRSPPRRHSPPKVMRARSRSPIHSGRSPARTNFALESRGSRSPLSRREAALRNRSPAPRHARSPPPSLNTVLVSDDELKPDDGLSPWNSDNDIESLGSLPDARSPAVRSRTTSVARSVHSRTDHSRIDHSRPDHSRPDHSRPAPPPEQSPENIVATLRILVALEDYLGSLGPKIIDLLAEAIRMEKEKANSSEELLEREAATMLIETAKEKLKGAAQAGLVAGAAAAAVRAAIVRAAATLHEADKRVKAKKESAAAAIAAAVGELLGAGRHRKGKRPRCRPRVRPRRRRTAAQKAAAGGGAGAGGGGARGAASAVPVAGVGAVDREQIARQMAAALIAQGKTDVSSEELAQLVDAVVGMAEAKKREADEKKQASAALMMPAPKTNALSGTASALQMLQSAYDDKKTEKEDTPDAMDGLSDSDLETLLKNFNELSAEEQHSLIAYLKKLEAREPQRVERLRQYVSAAAHSAPAPSDSAPAAPAPAALAPAPVADTQPVTIESDDDDYTVEEVFKSVTEKVKEDQIRQEMEIVKKSLEETNVTAAQIATSAASASSLTKKLDILKNQTSATDLFALVQASLQSQANIPAGIPKTGDVVTSSTHTRSFGDLPESHNPTIPQNTSNFSNNIQLTQPTNQLLEPLNQQAPLRVRQNMGGSAGNNLLNEPTPLKEPVWETWPTNKTPEVEAPQVTPSYGNNYQQDNSNYSQGRGPQDNFYNQNRGPQDNSYNQNRGLLDNPSYNQGQDGAYNQRAQEGNYNDMNRQDNSYNQMNRAPQSNSFNQGGRGPLDTYNQGGRGAQNNYQMGGRQDGSYNQGGLRPQGNYNQGGQGQDVYNQGGRGNYDMNTNRMQDSRQNMNQNNRRGWGARGHAGRGRGRGRGGFN